ncbi:amidohydrolase [Catenulispora sp. NL8]|uniref:Amidohydrolase n=1 Tax=Catenulispora pinistramenti TaxID=2705254 RepID=A0ABS5L1C3_9ACTN|nr:M20 family metallopeptidase [Catenulispora pinistramenti]MBS2552125.1 amidohydrolase [Catenulispora pinistramenti]
MTVLEDAREIQPDLVRLRRELHADPEVGLLVPRTRERVLSALDGLDLEVTLGRALTSVTAVVRTRRPDAVAPVLLRADLDALPLTEDTGLDYASRTPGAAHACGHDLHAAMLIGAARLLAARRHRLPGDVILMFQPGEEGHDGARLMLREGLLDAAGDRPAAAYALHAASSAPLGRFGARSGPALAASGTVEVVLRGSGGHGAWPHAARDPIPALGATIGALQTMVTRRFDALEPVLVSVGQVRAGTAPNIIPETAQLAATLRAFSDTAHRRLVAEIERVVHGVAAAHGVQAEITHSQGYPVTVNDPAAAGFVADVCADLFGAERYAAAERPALVSDDIGRVLAEVPGVMVSLGTCPPGLDPRDAAPNHSPRAVFDDSVIADGAALLTELALRTPPKTTEGRPLI